MEKEYRVESLLSINQDRKGDFPSGLFYLDECLFSEEQGLLFSWNRFAIFALADNIPEF